MSEALDEWRRNYAYSGRSTCSCGKVILWFKTPQPVVDGTPARRLPVSRELFLEHHGQLGKKNPDQFLRGLVVTPAAAQTELLPFNHFADCPKADAYRRLYRMRRGKSSLNVATGPEQMELFG